MSESASFCTSKIHFIGVLSDFSVSGSLSPKERLTCPPFNIIHGIFTSSVIKFAEFTDNIKCWISPEILNWEVLSE